MHGTITTTTLRHCPTGTRFHVGPLVGADGGFDRAAIMRRAHDRLHNGKVLGATGRWSVAPTWRECLRAAWDAARDERAIHRDRIELATRAAFGDVATPANTLEFADGLRQQLEFNRSLAS